MSASYTLALIKPDAYERRLVGQIVAHAEGAGFEIIGLRTINPLLPAVQTALKAFYARQHEGREYFKPLLEFMATAPSVVMILSHRTAADTIERWREVMGPWKPVDRFTGKYSHTIRGFYMVGDDTMRNLVHGSDCDESFNHELATLGRAGLLP